MDIEKSHEDIYRYITDAIEDSLRIDNRTNPLGIGSDVPAIIFTNDDINVGIYRIKNILASLFEIYNSEVVGRKITGGYEYTLSFIFKNAKINKKIIL